MSLTVVLTNYRRPQNIPIILDALIAQTLRPEIFVWDNSPDLSFQDGRADWVIHSSQNAGCSGRWWLARQANTDAVLIMDDDLVPADQNLLQDTMNKLAEYHPQAVGAAGVVLNPERKYFQCHHVGLDYQQPNRDIHVDILKGRFMAVPTTRLRDIAAMKAGVEDDIIVSSSLGGGVVASGLAQRFRELPTGNESLSKRPEHAARREATRRAYLER